MSSPTLIDLFCGCGGLSLGASRAGFRVVAGVELDQRALSVHARNFPSTRHLNKDISLLSGSDLLESAGLPTGGLDVLVGGPPCQGFSSIGKKRMDDKRNSLFSHFCRLVNETKPRAFLIENVPGVLDERYESVLRAAFKILGKEYRVLEPMLVSANDFLAPTSRRRVFFAGLRDDVPNQDDELYHRVYSQQSAAPKVKIALSGLPTEISSDWENSNGILKVETSREDPFLSKAANHFPLNVGDDSTVERFIKFGEVGNNFGTLHSPELEERYGLLKFGERDPITRSVRLDPNGYCPTLRAGTAPERGSFQAVRPIHFSAPRVITPREAARLQGFPDWFFFEKTKWHTFRHVGNSVSPLVSEVMLTALKDHAF